MKRAGWFWVAAVVLLVGCAGGPGSDWVRPDSAPAGFWAGLWHGALLLITLVVSFFTQDVSIYEIHNSGGYNIGFVLGVLAVYGSGSASVRVTRRKRRKEDLERRIEKEVKARFLRWLERVEELDGLGEKIEKKVKKKLRRWLDEE